MKRKVIIITDGDNKAKLVVEALAKKVGGRCISLSAGNPTKITSSEAIEFVKAAPKDPVFVMADDRGKKGFGLGEEVMMGLFLSQEIEVIGIIAVASNCYTGDGIEVDSSVDVENKVSHFSVNKNGIQQKTKVIFGDTLNFLNKLKDKPYIVGIGDPGKMRDKENPLKDVSILEAAVKEILEQYRK